MKISILGTNGFLSTSIGKFCNSENYYLDMYGLFTPVNHAYDNFYKVDFLADTINYTKLCESDMIIYCSGAGIQSNLHEKSSLIYALNVTVPISICINLRIENYKGLFVTFGSVFEIGETPQKSYFSEKDILTSLWPAPNDYVVSKRMLSRFISSYKHDFIHWHFYIPTIYGAGENVKRLIPYTINAIKNNEPLCFTAGEQVRQYIHVSEIPKVLKCAYEKKLCDGEYNIEGKETLSVKEIVVLIHSFLGKELLQDCFGSAQRLDVGMKFLALNGNKLKQAIGFEASVSLSNVLQEY